MLSEEEDEADFCFPFSNRQKGMSINSSQYMTQGNCSEKAVNGQGPKKIETKQNGLVLIGYYVACTKISALFLVVSHTY